MLVIETHFTKLKSKLKIRNIVTDKLPNSILQRKQKWHKNEHFLLYKCLKWSGIPESAICNAL